MQKYIFLHELTPKSHTFLHELYPEAYTFLHEHKAKTYTFLRELSPPARIFTPEYTANLLFAARRKALRTGIKLSPQPINFLFSPFQNLYFML